MNKIWIALLFCSTSLSATEKTRFDWVWQVEPKQDEKINFTFKWREDEKVEKPDTTLEWQNKPVNEMAGAPPYALRHNQYTRPNLLDNIHRSNRQRVIDPIFSSSTSDGGYVPQRYRY